jgi:hypothetical protein
MAKKKRVLSSAVAEDEDCNADILPARSKKSRDERKQQAARDAKDDAVAEASAAPQSRRARKVMLFGCLQQMAPLDNPDAPPLLLLLLTQLSLRHWSGCETDKTKTVAVQPC